MTSSRMASGTTASIRLCRDSIAQNSKSFALASRLLPPEARDPTAVVYAWCRRADDAIDFVSGDAQRVALDDLRRELRSVYAGDAQSDPVLSAFQQVVAWYGIPEHYPEELLSGMAMDALDFRYQSWDQLLLYCYRVASTVGLMMCHVMGVSDGVALRHAAHLGMAMQLTNIARDVQEDWQRGRLYLPSELLARHGVEWLESRLGGSFPTTAVEACRPALQELLAVADRYYASGDDGLRYLSTRNALAVGAARAIYSAIGTELAHRDFDVLAPRAYVPFHKKLLLCAKVALSTAWRHRPGSKGRMHWAPAFQPAPLETIEYDSDVVAL